MRSITIFALLFFNLGLCAQQNLIYNPGAEETSLSGWTKVSGNWVAAVQRGPHEGARHFYAGNPNFLGQAEIYQNVDVSSYATDINAGNATFTFSAWTASFNDQPTYDGSRIIIEFRNASGILSSYNSGERNFLDWELYQLIVTAPANTTTIRIRLQSIRHQGTASDGYFDDLSLTVATPAPVSLIFFNAIATEDQVLLSWQTAHEAQNAGFEIEKSLDGVHWYTLGSVPGAGTSHTLQVYQFADLTPTEGLQYYRLKQIDYDGSHTHYAAKIVRHRTGEDDIKIEMAQDQITLSGALMQSVDIYTTDGKWIAHFNNPTDGNTFVFSTTCLPQGLLLFYVSTEPALILKKAVYLK